MNIIAEAPGYRAAVLDLNRRAFGGYIEADIIERLDRDRLIAASLVAIEKDEVVGHILFSALDVEVEGQSIRAVALAPMCVAPKWQHNGIGTRLVKSGIAAMRNASQQAIIVLGHEHFYRRFGFRHDLVQNLACDYNQSEAFMGLELAPACLAGKAGACRYPAAFGQAA
jgi:putative acetyltransferase